VGSSTVGLTVVVPAPAAATALTKAIAEPSTAAAAKAAIQFLRVSMIQSSYGVAGCVIPEESHSASGTQEFPIP